MVHFRQILVGISDPERPERSLLGRAARLASRSGARLHLVHAYSAVPKWTPSSNFRSAEELLASHEASLRKRLEHIAKPLRRRGLKVEVDVIRDTPPHEALIRQVRLCKADLLVVQVHRHSKLARFFMTYTDWELIRQCPCPVWLVKSGTARPAKRIAAAVDPLHARAGAGRLDDRILEIATSVARLERGRVTVCHVADMPVAYQTGGVFAELVPVPAPVAVQKRYLALVTQAVTAVARRHGIPARAVKIEPGIAADGLPQMARRLSANVLVMGSVSRSGIDRLLIGSTAERVIDRVHCDLLIVKPARFRSPVPKRRRSTTVIP